MILSPYVVFSPPAPPDYRYRQGRNTWLRHRNLYFDYGDLQARCYEGNAIKNILINNTRIPLYAKLSSSDIRLLQKILIYSSTSKAIKEILGVYLRILDKAFFFGAIAKVCRLQVEAEHGQSYRANYSPSRKTIVLVLEGQTTGCFIGILKDYIAKLLHEMLHAFLQIYTCQCSECRANGNAIADRDTTGHREQWVDSLRAIQSALFRDLGWNLDLGIPESVSLEVTQTGWRPTGEQLLRWDVVLTGEPDVIDRGIGRAKKRSSKSWIY